MSVWILRHACHAIPKSLGLLQEHHVFILKGWATSPAPWYVSIINPLNLWKYLLQTLREQPFCSGKGLQSSCTWPSWSRNGKSLVTRYLLIKNSLNPQNSWRSTRELKFEHSGLKSLHFLYCALSRESRSVWEFAQMYGHDRRIGIRSVVLNAFPQGVSADVKTLPSKYSWEWRF